MGATMRFQSSRVGIRLVILATIRSAAPSRSRFRMISPSPNMPMATVTKPMPSINSLNPKVYRWVPEFTSVPMSAEEQPQHDHADGLEQGAAGEDHGGDEAQDHEGKVLRGAEA